MRKVIFFNNGNTAVFNAKGQQMPFLQRSWFLMFLDFLIEEGIDVEGCEFETQSGLILKPIKLKGGGYNWEVL